MSSDTGNLTGDMVWQISSDKEMIVRNVLYSMVETDGEDYQLRCND